MCLASIFDLSKVNMASGRKTICITHNKDAHADDIFAGALLKLALGENNVVIKRTRDLNAIGEADIIFDIGKSYDGRKYFDHHQEDPVIYQSNGIKHCAFTLLAKSLIKDRKFYDKFMQVIGNGIAIRDNGQTNLMGKYSSLGLWAKFFNKTYYEDLDNDDSYTLSVNLAQAIIVRVIKHIEAWFKTEEKVIEYANKAKDGLLILDNFVPYEDYICENYPDILMCVYPSADRNEWFLTSLPLAKGDTHYHKIYMPSDWCGYSNKMDFGHRANKHLDECKFVSFRGYHSSWNSKDAAIEAARYTVANAFADKTA